MCNSREDNLKNFLNLKAASCLCSIKKGRCSWWLVGLWDRAVLKFFKSSCKFIIVGYFRNSQLKVMSWNSCILTSIGDSIPVMSLLGKFRCSIEVLVEFCDPNALVLFVVQKKPSIGVLIKRCSEIMQQIYRRTPKPKCDLINLLHIFRTPFNKNTLGGLLLIVDGKSYP